MLPRPTVKEEVHLQENTLLDLWTWPRGQGHTKCCSVPSFIMWPIHLQGLRLPRPTVEEEMHLQENTLFDIWPWPWVELAVKVTQNVAQYPLHHVTYSPAKFEVAMPNCFWGDPFTRNSRDVSTNAHMHKSTQDGTRDQLWYEINNKICTGVDADSIN